MFDLLEKNALAAKYDRTFTSPGDFLKYCDRVVAEVDNPCPGYLDRYPAGKPQNWGSMNVGRMLNLTYEETRNRVKLGWPEGAEILAKNKVSLVEKMEQAIKRQTWDVTGHTLDVGRMLTGEPECFRRRRKTKGEPRMLTMALTLGVSSGESQNSLLGRHAYALALVDVLEQRNCRVRIVVTMSCYSDKTGDKQGGAVQTINFRIKDFHETVSSSSLATWLGTPEIYRRMAWLCRDADPTFYRNCGFQDRTAPCNDLQTFKAADIWFPRWNNVPSEALCRVWLFALGFVGNLEWSAEERACYRLIKQMADTLEKEIPEMPVR